ncbi:HAD family hydrolase [Roseomonas sp. CCTCC AB2023176]|uniref:HAD family hydrolase n=1 Tax=Roseomonas sp. CCTCC AB2023176 TaxID=3342640 RepID=UPI0035D5514F
MTPRRPAAVLFDCDGVLADSEMLVNAIVAEDLTSRGWPLTAEASKDAFMGLSWPDMVPLVEAKVGRLPSEWPSLIAGRIAEEVARDVPAIPGAREAVAAIAAAGLPIAVASNAGRRELLAKLGALGLRDAFGERVFSFQDVPRPKPHPDIYVAAAASCGAASRDCVVIEDSAVGTRAGVAAGCRVLGFAHDTPALDLLEAGAAETFTDMAALPRLIGIA